MDNKILGLHHITAIAGDAQRNYNFYTQVLGLRMVKKTVNFDDPYTYHFYFGDEVGSPGSILTFFPWSGVRQGRNGTGMATAIGYSVPKDSLSYWTDRFERYGIRYNAIQERLGEQYLSFSDPDGLAIDLIVPQKVDERKPWETDEVKAGVALKGFHSVTLSLRSIQHTADILTNIFGYRLLKQEGNRYRFITDAVEGANIVDLLEFPSVPAGINAGGTNHHVAFRVKDDLALMEYREKILSKGFNITPKIDRNYFYSLYFREPGGVLFEIATDNPGFAIDEPVEALGKSLKLPPQYEATRKNIEAVLPQLT
jgi:glyoxalase family protein